MLEKRKKNNFLYAVPLGLIRKSIVMMNVFYRYAVPLGLPLIRQVPEGRHIGRIYIPQNQPQLSSPRGTAYLKIIRALFCCYEWTRLTFSKIEFISKSRDRKLLFWLAKYYLSIVRIFSFMAGGLCFKLSAFSSVNDFPLEGVRGWNLRYFKLRMCRDSTPQPPQRGDTFAFQNEILVRKLQSIFRSELKLPRLNKILKNRKSEFQIILPLFFLLLFITSCPPEPKDNSNLKTIGKGALLTTRFQSLEEFKTIVEIEYSDDRKSWVRLRQKNNGQELVSHLEKGVKESDFLQARNGSFWDKLQLGFNSPYFVANRNDLLRIYVLSRRRDKIFGGEDVAFYHIAKRMQEHILPADVVNLPADDISEKGFLNTFNHITSQTFMTSIYSEKFADFVADCHERTNMPELISGNFSTAQMADIKNGAVDNYVDVINNEWGQELGKVLKQKYGISEETFWTPELLANYLNDIQLYYSWNFEIGFQPFRASDSMVVKFSKKINRVMADVKGLV